MKLALSRNLRWLSFTAAIALTQALALPLAHSQAYPGKPVKLIVPLPPGSGADIAARVVGKKLAELWGQAVVIENRPGAGGQIGSQLVARSAPDGYTLLVQSATHAVNPAIYKSLPYDPSRDFIDVAMLSTTPYVMVTAADGPHKSLQSLIDAAKAKPGAEPYASAGIGTSTHLTAELFAQRAGIRMLHVPFKGSPEAITDVAGGRCLFYMAPLSTVGGMLKDGKVTALAVTAEKRVERLPNVPTLAESSARGLPGLAGFKVDLWVGLWAPAGTPAEVINKLSTDIRRALQSEEITEQYAKGGNDVRLMSPDVFAKFVRDEIETNKTLVRNAGITPE